MFTRYVNKVSVVIAVSNEIVWTQRLPLPAITHFLPRLTSSSSSRLHTLIVFLKLKQNQVSYILELLCLLNTSFEHFWSFLIITRNKRNWYFKNSRGTTWRVVFQWPYSDNFCSYKLYTMWLHGFWLGPAGDPTLLPCLRPIIGFLLILGCILKCRSLLIELFPHHHKEQSLQLIYISRVNVEPIGESYFCGHTVTTFVPLPNIVSDSSCLKWLTSSWYFLCDCVVCRSCRSWGKPWRQKMSSLRSTLPVWTNSRYFDSICLRERQACTHTWAQ